MGLISYVKNSAKTRHKANYSAGNQSTCDESHQNIKHFYWRQPDTCYVKTPKKETLSYLHNQQQTFKYWPADIIFQNLTLVWTIPLATSYVLTTMHHFEAAPSPLAAPYLYPESSSIHES